MSRVAALSAWVSVVSMHLPHLSQPQARTRAWYSFAMVFTQSCGRSTVAVFLAALLGKREDAVRPQVREWTYDAAAKKGAHRAELAVSTCFAPLLRWVLRWWDPDHRQLVLVLDATYLGDRFIVLAVSLVYRGCAIPLAWKVVGGHEPGSWQPHWCALLEALRGAVPQEWTVLVMADRGLYAAWLFHKIVACGWHPFLRLRLGGQFRPAGGAHWRDMRTLVPTVGSQWCGRAECFKTRPGRLACTLLARWEAGYTDPWLIVTDLPPEGADIVWYGLRSWIESGFKDLKRGGWHWEQTKHQHADRVERQWLAMAVATLWVVSVGGAAEADLPASGLDQVPEWHIARRTVKSRSRARVVSCFRRGLIRRVVAAVAGAALPCGGFVPDAWPRSTADAAAPTAAGGDASAVFAVLALLTRPAEARV